MLTWKEKQDNRTGKFDIVLQKQENSNYITLLTPFDWFQETCRTCETFSTFPVTGLNMAWHWGIWKCPVRLQSIFFFNGFEIFTALTARSCVHVCWNRNVFEVFSSVVILSFFPILHSTDQTSSFVILLSWIKDWILGSASGLLSDAELNGPVVHLIHQLRSPRY